MPITTYIALLTVVLGLAGLTVALLSASSTPLTLLLPAGLAASALLFLWARRK